MMAELVVAANLALFVLAVLLAGPLGVALAAAGCLVGGWTIAAAQPPRDRPPT